MLILKKKKKHKDYLKLFDNPWLGHLFQKRKKDGFMHFVF